MLCRGVSCGSLPRMAKQGAASNLEWQRWGDADPFWGVASWAGRERGGDNPWSADEFYELGWSDWRDFSERWRQYGVANGTALEIGCGAGRLTKHMAQDFLNVIGVDVAEGMLAMARTHVNAANVDFRLGDGCRLPADTASVDAIFSTHVFQHFDSLQIARSNIAEMARVLRPDGSIMVHAPVYLPPRAVPLVEPLVALRRRVADVRAAVRRRQGKPLMRLLEYSWLWLQREFAGVGFTGIELVIFSVRSNDDPHPFVLARTSH